MVSLYSTFKMMHGPINIRHTALFRSLTALSITDIRYIHTRFRCRNIKERKKLEDLGLNGSIILKQTLTKEEEGVRTKSYSG